MGVRFLLTITINKASEQEYNTLSESTAKGTITSSKGLPTTVKADAQRRAGELEAQSANQRLADTADYPDRSNELVRIITQQGDRVRAKLGEIAEIKRSSNPLTHIIGAFTIPFKADEAQAEADIGRSAAKELSIINESIQSSAKTNSEIATRMTEATNSGQIRIEYKELPDGAEITYSTEIEKLKHAIHQWFDAQLSDHARHAIPGHSHHHPMHHK